MKKKKNNVPLILFILVAVGAGAYLAIAKTSSSTVYFYTVEEIFAATDLPEKAIRISGNVVAGSIDKDLENMVVRFKVTDASKKELAVTYQGPIPDIFNDDVQVVVEGRLQDDLFVATNLMAKCPSKYEQDGSMEDFEDADGHPEATPDM